MIGDDRQRPRLTEGQEAARARILYALEQPAGVAILCGPAGTGVSTVLHEVLGRVPAGGGAHVARTVDAARRRLSAGGVATLLVDDAHLTGAPALAELVSAADDAGCTGLVLGGQGRLLSLVHRAPDLDRRVRIRAILRPLSVAETMAIAGDSAPAVRFGSEALRVLHEIAGGIPAVVVGILHLCAVVAAAEPDRPIETADVEAIHARLTTAAA